MSADTTVPKKTHPFSAVTFGTSMHPPRAFTRSMFGKNMSEDESADLLAFVLAGRPDRLQGVATAMQPEPLRKAAAEMTNVVAALALSEPADLPSADLRSRLMKSLAKSPRREALVIVDMINDHLERGSILEVPRAREIVPALVARIDAARANNIPIVFVIDQHDPTDTDLDDWGVHAVAGTAGAEVWPALTPKHTDRVVPKPSYSGFFSSKLESVLEELGVDTLVLTGCSTEVQLFSTTTDALQKGFAVEIPTDLQAGLSAEAEQNALNVLSMLLPYKPAREARLARLATL